MSATSAAASGVVPALDFSVLTQLAIRSDQYQAVREYRNLLRGK